MGSYYVKALAVVEVPIEIEADSPEEAREAVREYLYDNRNETFGELHLYDWYAKENWDVETYDEEEGEDDDQDTTEEGG